jgi:hypothetical protein
MWGFLVEIAIVGGLKLYDYLTKPSRPKQKPLTKDNLTLPRVEEDSPVPLVYGRTRVTSPLLVYTSPLQTQTVGGENPYIVYALDMLFVAGLPMGNGVTKGNSLAGPQLHNVWIGDFKLPPPTQGALPSVGHKLRRQQNVYRPGALGGPGNGGGYVGSYQFFGGYTDQSFLSPASPIGDSIARVHIDTSSIPGNTKQMCVSLARISASNLDPYFDETGADTLIQGTIEPDPRPTFGFVLGENPSVNGVSFEVSTYGDKVFAMAAPGFDFGGDADPVEVIYDLMVNKWSRAGLDAADIDTTSFLAASTTLKSESHGYSNVIYQAESGIDVINSILKQIDAALYKEPTTGKWVIKLIRADYDPATIPAFNKSNIVAIDEYALGAWRETVNEVRVNYTDRSREYTTTTVAAQSLANMSIQDNRRRVRSIDYPGCTNATLAGKLAARDLNALSQPLSHIRMTVNRDGHMRRPGDAVKINYPEYNIVDGIFRVKHVDLGQLFANAIVLELVQDVFASTYVGMPQPTGTFSNPTPYPLAKRIVTEAPRWLVAEAWNAGMVSEPDIPHLLPLPIASPQATQYEMRTREHPATVQQQLHNQWLVDIPQLDFPTTFTIQTSYGREVEPYDDSIGLVIENVAGPLVDAGYFNALEFLVASQTEIKNDGKNLIVIVNDDGEMEFMAFESVTDNTGGVFTLNNVWRGLFDTPPLAHAVGVRGFFVNANMIGRRGWSVLKLLDVAFIPRSTFVVGSGEDPIDSFQSIGRALMPLPPADAGIAGEACAGTDGMTTVGRRKSISLLEEAFDTYGVQRDRLKTTISRGDEATETLNDLTSLPAATTLVKVNGVNRAYAPGGVPLGVGAGGWNGGGWLVDGYGSLDIELGFSRTLQTGDPAIGKGGMARLTTLSSWRNAKIRAFMPSWRNLFGNCRFNYGSGSEAMWDQVGRTGVTTIQSGTTSLQLAASGSGSYYDEGGSASVTRAQRCVVSRWNPRGLTAAFVGYIRNTQVDTSDTAQLKCESFNLSGVSQGSNSDAAAAGATGTWTRRQVLHTIPATVTSVQGQFLLAEVAGGGNGNANVAFTEPELRIGQFSLNAGSPNLLANYSFESGLTSWTVDSGAATTTALIASPSANYATPNAATMAVIHQDYTLPSGFEVGTTAVVTCFKAWTNTNDTNDIKVAALDGSNNVLASGSTGGEQNSVTGQWFKRTVFCDVPDGSTKIRVTWTAGRAAAGNSGALIDEIVLWVVKDLAPGYENLFDFSAPTVQEMPATWQSYSLAFPSNPQPTYVFGGQDFNGQEVSWTDSAAHASAKLVGNFGDGVTSVNAYPFVRGTGSTALHAAATGQGRTNLAAFDSARSFSAVVFYRVDESGFATAAGLLGRMDLTAGWGLKLDNSGNPVATLRGDAGSKTAIVARSGSDGALHMAAVVYDAAAFTLTVYDETGAGTPVSTASGLGEFSRSASTCHLRIGRDEDATAVLPGQIARVYIFDGVALAGGEVAAHWNYAKDPSSLVTTYTRTAKAVVPVKSDSEGELACIMSASQVAVTYRPNLTTDGGTGFGLAVGRSSTNLIPTWDYTASASWVKDASTTLTQGISDIQGVPRGVQVSGDASNGLKIVGLAIGASAATIGHSFWARSVSGSTSLDVQLLSSADAVITTQTVTLTTLWKRFDLSHAWTGVTATCRLRFKSNSGAIVFQLAQPMYAGNAASNATYPALIPMPNSTHGDYNATASITLPKQFNVEGEIVVEGQTLLTGWASPTEGTLVQIKNGSNDKNRREIGLRPTSNATIRFHHYDSVTPTDVTSDIVYATHWHDRVWKARGRWAACGLTDVTAGRFAQSAVSDNVATTVSEGAAGRTAIWTYDTTQSTSIKIGAGTAAPEDVVLRTVIVRAREEKLP